MYKELLVRLAQKDFWHGERKVGRNFVAGKLGGYYNDLTAKTMPYDGPRSAEGVPLVRVSDSRKRRFVLHPVTVCQVALGWHERWLQEQSDYALDGFLKLADWLVANQEAIKDMDGVWPVPYAVSMYRLSPGWVSALVQGQAISVLARAYKVTSKTEYLLTAERALKPFQVDVISGGVRNYDRDGRVFFEECPTVPSSRILNGFVSALWGVYDYTLLTEDDIAEAMFTEGVNTLITSLPLYDTGYWSRYSLFRYPGFSNIASPYYHKEHIAQLRATYILVNSEQLRSMADRWESYLQRWTNLVRVVSIKSLSRILMRFQTVHHPLSRSIPRIK